ncbi:MAG: hypothetical protein ACE5LF_04325 [Alphaproteobacteria bacterium]
MPHTNATGPRPSPTLTPGRRGDPCAATARSAEPGAPGRVLAAMRTALDQHQKMQAANIRGGRAPAPENMRLDTIL